jgi:hypothetical protein
MKRILEAARRELMNGHKDFRSSSGLITRHDSSDENFDIFWPLHHIELYPEF